MSRALRQHSKAFNAGDRREQLAMTLLLRPQAALTAGVDIPFSFIV